MHLGEDLTQTKAEQMNVLDLFSGIGGFSLGLERAGMKTIAFCEIDPWCRKILEKHWPDTPIHEDIRTLNGETYRNAVDLICGGYPCQPFSHAGKRKGAKDTRLLWPEMFRLIRELRPAWVIGENVAGHISMGLDETLFDLESEGYQTRAFVIPAVGVDAPHKRDRVWIIGYANGIREPTMPINDETPRMQAFEGIGSKRHPVQWPAEPGMGRVANGIPRRVDRIRGLGNAVVPQIVEAIGRSIIQSEGD